MKNIFDPKYPITKMHGTGNDFVIYVDFDELTRPDNARQICDRHFGVGADGVITVAKSRVPQAKYRMKYFNSDGSVGEMCGNGIRCFAKYLVDNELVSKMGAIPVDTDAGLLIPEILKNTVDGASVRVNMGKPVLKNPKQVTVSVNNKGLVQVTIEVTNSEKKIEKLTGTYAGMGNPHVIFFVDKGQAEQFVKVYGPQIEVMTDIFPQKTNVEFAEINDKKDITMHVWERAAGLTLSCGTGACATLTAAVLNGLSDNSAKIHLPGGTLEVSWAGKDEPIFMTGPAVNVFNISSLNLL